MLVSRWNEQRICLPFCLQSRHMRTLFMEKLQDVMVGVKILMFRVGCLAVMYARMFKVRIIFSGQVRTFKCIIRRHLWIIAKGHFKFSIYFLCFTLTFQYGNSIERYISVMGMSYCGTVEVKFRIGIQSFVFTQIFAILNTVIIYFMDFLNFKVLVETDIAQISFSSASFSNFFNF